MPRPNRYTGTMLKMDGTNLVLEARQPGGGTTQLIIPTDARTPVWINGARSHLEDLKPGMTISGLHFAATPAGPARFTVNATDPELNGTLIKVDGTNLVVKVSEPGSEPHEVNVSTDQKTRVRYITPAEEGGFSVVADSAKVADLKPGSAIGVFPGHGMAARISVTVATNAPAPGPAGGPPQQ